jgi:hypothetical protein
MNDADVAGLNQLCYALRRRFAIIRVEVPLEQDIRNVIKEAFEDAQNRILVGNHSYIVGTGKKYEAKEEFKCTIENGRIKERLAKNIEGLFAIDGEEDNDLIDLNIVGIASLKDTIRFMAEGIRVSDTNNRTLYIGSGNKDAKDIACKLVDSFLALGLILNVFPQLDSVINDCERFKRAIAVILNTFDKDENLHRIQLGQPQRNKTISDSGLTIRNFLVNELRQQFKTDPYAIKIVEDVARKPEDIVKGESACQ